MSIIPFPYNLAAAGAAAIAIAGTTFAFTRGHYIAQYEQEVAMVKQGAADDAARIAQQVATDKTITQEKQNEDAQNLSTYATTVASLSGLLNHPNHPVVSVCSNPSGTSGANPVANGPATTGSAGSTQGAQGTGISIDPTVLLNTIDTAISGTQAVLDWRQFYSAMKDADG